jgi:ribosomal protein S18 acetylase RimI-like enzyme
VTEFSDAEARFLGWHRTWKRRVCDQVTLFSHGQVYRSARYPDYWSYNCIEVERPMSAQEMVEAADHQLADCPHRFAEWVVPMPEEVISELRARDWIVMPLIYMLHDGRELSVGEEQFAEVEYDAVRGLRELWHDEDFGDRDDHPFTEAFYSQAREVAGLADVRVIAALREGRPIGFAQLQTHDGGSEVTEVYVHPDHRAAGLGAALTTQAIHAGAAVAADIWICADRDGRPRELYKRLGFEVVLEIAVAMIPPSRA